MEATGPVGSAVEMVLGVWRRCLRQDDPHDGWRREGRKRERESQEMWNEGMEGPAKQRSGFFILFILFFFLWLIFFFFFQKNL